MAALLAISCDTNDADDPRDERVVLDGKSDGGGFVEGSPEAVGVLRVVNQLSRRDLDDKVGLSADARNNIVRARPFTSLSALDDVDFVGQTTFDKIHAYAETQGWIPALPAEWASFGYVGTETYELERLGPSSGGVVFVNGPYGPISYTVVVPGELEKLRGFGFRYESPDGRVAYLGERGQRVGPVRPGTYFGKGQYRCCSGNVIDDLDITIRVADLTLKDGAYHLLSADVFEAWQYVLGPGWIHNYLVRKEPSVAATDTNTYGGLELGQGLRKFAFSAIGELTAYDLVIDFNSNALQPRISHITNLVRGNQSCPVPYGCIDERTDGSVALGQVFGTEAACKAEVQRLLNLEGFSRRRCKRCAPAMVECAP